MTQKQYCDFSADLATPRQRSIRINGFATCLRLEEIYWRIIEVLAERESVTVGKLLSRWAMEMDLSCEVVKNFTGYVRVTCVVQLARQAITVGTKEITLLLSAISSTVEP